MRARQCWMWCGSVGRTWEVGWVLRQVVLTALVAGTALADEDVGEGELLQSDSEAPYVHRLTLYDHDGTAISPEDAPAMPYSPRATCGKCHPYGEIGHGWHFDEDEPDATSGRPGEPWLLVDEHTGSVIPISGRGWHGAFSPGQVGLSHWGFVKQFGRHMPGGSYGEPSDAIVDESEYYFRWNVSGPLEIDCMICHSSTQVHDPAEAARQIERENYKWLPAVALGLAVVRGEAAKAPDDWDPWMPPNPDKPEAAGPTLIYDAGQFDPDERVLFEITRRVPNERCYFCHTVRLVGEDVPESWERDQDVHLAAGLMCVDCHRHGLDHAMTRGYAGEAHATTQPTKASLSCRGCHLGEAEATTITAALGGRLRAPHPQHRGLPPVHFETMTCTACHAGPWPEMEPARVHTALAHALGIATRERTAETSPAIWAPVFGRQDDGLIAPQRTVWPTYWGRVVDGELEPIALEDVKQAMAEAGVDLDENGWTDEWVAAVGEAFSGDESAGEIVFVHDGRVLALSGDVSTGAEVAQPYRWSLGHDVRPAAQSLGVRGCDDCHADDGAVYFGRVLPAAEVAENGGSLRNAKMVAFRGDDEALAQVWAWGFVFRPAFKVLGVVCAVVIALVLLRGFSDGFHWAAFGEVPRAAAECAAAAPRGMSAAQVVFHTLAKLGILIGALTAFGSEIVWGEFGGWALVLHMGGAGVFIVGLTGVALLWARQSRLQPRDGSLTPGQRVMFWVGLLVSWVVLVTMLAAMWPVFGYAGQHNLVELHELAALVLLAVMVVHTVISLRARRKHV